jgi:hypothetical protein
MVWLSKKWMNDVNGWIIFRLSFSYLFVVVGVRADGFVLWQSPTTLDAVLLFRL